MIVGVDLSTHRIDLAWIDPIDARPRRWQQELTGKSSIDRIRQIEIHWPYWPAQGVETTEVVIEWPFGRSSNYLMAVVGILTHQAPTWARVSWLKCSDLRTAIGAKNTKRDAHEAIHMHVCPVHERDECILTDWDEHELDALVTCLGGTHILEHPTNQEAQPHA